MKLNSHLHQFAGSVLASACLLLSSHASHAAITFHVDLNTAALTGNWAGPFYLDFQLNDGSGTFAGVNTLSITNFTLTGGTPTGSAILAGGATGALTSSVTLTDGANAINELYQGFTDGTTKIGFDVNLTTVSDPSAPDEFTVAILDNTTGQILTNDPLQLSLVAAAIGSSLTIGGVQTYSSLAPTAGVTATVTPVPEPGVGVCLLGELGMLAGLRRRHLAA